ncbi:hypothetical protein LTS15_002732 [Exophiala xenobiotica]|nr:hypothetical protein LTS15_002732 [Exophiala xenobiotica]
MPNTTGRIDLDAYSIVWLCPLPVETTAALFMFDEHHEGIIHRQHGRSVEYHFGRIGSHNVAVAGFPSGEVGIGKAGAMAEAVIRDFKTLELGLLTGIGAAIPSNTRDIRLGDVAVADPEGQYPGIVAYDMVKVVPGEERPKQWLDATHPLWRSVISKIRARSTVVGDTFHQHLKAFDKPQAKKFRNPYLPLPLHPAFEDSRRDSDNPVVHYGTILSGDKVVRATDFRDKLKEKYHDPVALEMEAAGVMNLLPVAVIRGISDSADPFKNDQWHARAAAVAAAYAKEMLMQLSSKSPPGTKCEPDTKRTLRGQLPSPWDFHGREQELATIAMHLDRGRQTLFEKSVLVLSGLSGAGKSQLALAYVKKQLAEDPKREIFWINGRDKRTFEASIVDIVGDKRKSQISAETQVTEDTDKVITEIVESFIEQLNLPGNTGWLMVVDDVTIWNPDAGLSENSAELNCYLDRIHHGSLLITTNRQSWLTSHEHVLSLACLDNLYDLSQTLQGLPLSLRLAITFIRKRGIRVADFLKMWNERTLDDTFTLIEPKLVQTLSLCFDELQARNPNAANLLTLFGFMDHRTLSFDLCLHGSSSELPPWLLDFGQNKNRFDQAIESLLDLSFIQLNNDETEIATYSIHPAVHSFARNRTGSARSRFIYWAITLIADNVPRASDKDYYRRCQAVSPHADQCMVYMPADNFKPQHLERLGALYRLLGRYDSACQLYTAVLDVLWPHGGPFLEIIAQVLNDLGLVYFGQRNFELANETFQKAIDVYSQLDHPWQDNSDDTFMCIIFNHGNASRMKQALHEAENDFNKVYEFFEEKRVTSNTSVAPWIEIMISRTLNALGEIRLQQGETRDALSMLQRALDLQSGHLDSAHPIVLATKLNIGRAYTDIGTYMEACDIIREVAERYAELWTADHHAAVTAKSELARAYMGYGQMMEELQTSDQSRGDVLKEAERLWVESLSFYGDKYGVTSEDALTTKANIALLQSVTGDLTMARRNMLQVFQQSTTPPQKVKAQSDLALICQQMGDVEWAKKHFAQAVEASKLLPEPSRTRELLRSMYHQARLYFSLGDRDTYSAILHDLTLQRTAEPSEWLELATNELANSEKLFNYDDDLRGLDQSQHDQVLPDAVRRRMWQMN